MGAFAMVIKSSKVVVPQEKRKELGEKLYKLMTLAGMMEEGRFSLYGTIYRTLKPIQFNDDGFYFSYNYFEEDTWEDAGYDEKKGRFWSSKLGHRQFALGILAGYALECAYLPCLSAIDYDGSVSTGRPYLMWANTALDEHYTTQNGDPWEIYLLLRELGQETYYSAKDFSSYWYTAIGFKGLMDIIAVTEGIQAVLDELGQEQYKEENDEEYQYRLGRKANVEFMIQTITQFKEESNMSVQEQYEYLIGLVRDVFTDQDNEQTRGKYDERNIFQMYCIIMAYKYTAVLGKIIADVYEKDFWEVWDRIKDVAKRETIKSQTYDYPTEEFFQVSKDDLIYFWTKEKPIEFSEDLQAWLQGLKSRFDQIMAEGVNMQFPFRRIKATLDFAQEHYVRIYVFDDFMNETMDYITDARFIALWQLFDEVLHDPENLKAASVLFEIADPNWVGSSRKCDQWGCLSSEDKFNKGRQAMRRFLALVANRDLRNKVFGF